jgi:hypothetical protein
MTRQLTPVTERILARLRGPRGLWIVAWALVPWLNAGANLLLETGARSAVWEQSRTLVVLNYAALSFAIVITLWGIERIARRLEGLRAATSDVLTPPLGQRPLGGVAFMGLWMLLAWLVPLLLTGLPDVVGVAVGVVVLRGALATFFLSLLRLHRQMVAVKASERVRTRALRRGLRASPHGAPA